MGTIVTKLQIKNHSHNMHQNKQLKNRKTKELKMYKLQWKLWKFRKIMKTNTSVTCVTIAQAYEWLLKKSTIWGYVENETLEIIIKVCT